MKDWNVVLTCRRNGEKGALKQLKYFGHFVPTGFRDVLRGFVTERPLFFEELLRCREMRDPLWRYVSRLVPIDVNFTFTLETFRERLGEVIETLAQRVPPGPFYVRIERRGHKGEIPTPEVEREMDGRIIAAHERLGQASHVDFEAFRTAVAVETFHDLGGAGVVPREEMGKYPFLKVP
ncbi:MAG TPA: THUMP domain-containing protein [Candidatus Deferrimicrobiaceae bacterium]